MSAAAWTITRLQHFLNYFLVLFKLMPHYKSIAAYIFAPEFYASQDIRLHITI